MIAYGLGGVRGPLSAAEIQNGADNLASKGTGKPPEAPRDLRYLPSSRGALVFWSLPVYFADIVKWRIYKDTEANMVTELSDRGTRQVSIELSAGTTPPVTNVFVTSVNAAGKESTFSVVKVSSTAETGAPSVPSAPPDYTDSSSGGRNRSYKFNQYQDQ